MSTRVATVTDDQEQGDVSSAASDFILVRTGGEPRSVRKGCWRQRPQSMSKTEEQIRSRDGDESNRCDGERLEGLETNEDAISVKMITFTGLLFWN